MIATDYIFSRTGASAPGTQYNTYIGNMGSTYPTAAALATKLGITEADIIAYNISGNDIEAFIEVPYSLGTQDAWLGTAITHYIDLGGLIFNMPTSCFHSCFSLVKFVSNSASINFGDYCFRGVRTGIVFEFPNLTAVNGWAFEQTSPEVLYLPSATTLGKYTGTQSEATVASMNLWSRFSRAYLHPNFQNSNEFEYTYLRDTLKIPVSHPPNFNAPTTPGSNSIGGVYATRAQVVDQGGGNAIDYFNVYVNGAFYGKLLAGEYITGLTPSTSYSIQLQAVDIYYNKSDLSGNIPVQTTALAGAGFEIETQAYYDRVYAYSGIVEDAAGVDTIVKKYKELNLYDSLWFGFNPKFGGRKIITGDLLERLFSFDKYGIDQIGHTTDANKPIFDTVAKNIIQGINANNNMAATYGEKFERFGHKGSFTLIYKINPAGGGNYYPSVGTGWGACNMHSNSSGGGYVGTTTWNTGLASGTYTWNTENIFIFTYDAAATTGILYKGINLTEMRRNTMAVPTVENWGFGFRQMNGKTFWASIFNRVLTASELTEVITVNEL